MTTDDRRLIEDYLHIQAISAEASRENVVCRKHVGTLRVCCPPWHGNEATEREHA